MRSQIQQILTKIQKYNLLIVKELYTTFLRHRLIGCLMCNIKRRHYSSLTDIEMKGLWVGSISKDNSVLA